MDASCGSQTIGRGVHSTADWNVAMQTITMTFTADMVNFMKLDFENEDMAPANSSAHTIDVNMPWEERSFLMDIIDSSKISAARDGARAANCSIFNIASWPAEHKKVLAELSS